MDDNGKWDESNAGSNLVRDGLVLSGSNPDNQSLP